MLSLVDEVRDQRELTKSSREVSSLVSTPGNPFVPSSRLVSDSALASLGWTEETERGLEQNFVLRIIAQQLHSAERALQKAPDSPFLMNNLGLSYLNSGKIEEAIGYFEKALEIKNGLIAPRLNLAKARLIKGDLEAALAIYIDLLPKYPKRALIHESLGEIYLRLALTKKISDFLVKAEDHLKQAGHGNPSALNNLGIVYMLQGNLRSALSSFKKALALEPRATKIHSNIALCYVKLKNYDKGVRHFTTSLLLDKQNVETAKALGKLYLSRKAYQSTAELLREYEKYAKEDTQLLESLAEALFYRKEYKSCLGYLLRVRQIFESSNSEQADLARVYNNLGCVYDALGEGHHAESFFKASLREMSGPTNEAIYNLANHLLKERRYEEAVPFIQALEEEAPDSLKTQAWRATVKNILARHYSHLNNYPKALEYLREALAIDENDTSAYASISYIFSEVEEDYDRAIRILREGLAHAPTNPTLLNNLAYNYLMKGELQKGRKLLDQIDEHEALESVHVQATRGLLLIKEHAIQEGARFYNAAIRLAKDEETKAQVRQKKNLELGRHFLGQRNNARAKKLFHEVLTIQSDSEVYRRQAEHLLGLC